MAAAWLRASTDQDCVGDAVADGHAGPMARTRVCPAAAVSRRGALLAQRRLLIQPFGIWHLAFGIWHLALGIWHLPFGICHSFRVSLWLPSPCAPRAARREPLRPLH